MILIFFQQYDMYMYMQIYFNCYFIFNTLTGWHTVVLEFSTAQQYLAFLCSVPTPWPSPRRQENSEYKLSLDKPIFMEIKWFTSMTDWRRAPPCWKKSLFLINDVCIRLWSWPRPQLTLCCSCFSSYSHPIFNMQAPGAMRRSVFLSLFFCSPS